MSNNDNPITEVLTDETMNKEIDKLGLDLNDLSTASKDQIDELLEVLGVVEPESDVNPDIEMEEVSTLPKRTTKSEREFSPEDEKEFRDIYDNMINTEQNQADEALYEEAKKKAAQPHEDNFEDTGKAVIVNDPITDVNIIRPLPPEDGEPHIEETLKEWVDSLGLGDISAADIEPAEDYDLDPATEEERTNRAYEEFLKDTKAEYAIEKDEDLKALLDVVVRARNEEKFDYYDALPERFKQEIDKSIVAGGQTPNKDTRKTAAEFIINGMIGDVNLRKEFVDIEEAIAKEFDLPDMPELYSAAFKDQIEITLQETADSLRETDPDKAATLDAIIQSFKDSYTYSRIIDGVQNNPKIRNRITKDVDRYDRFCSDINRMMQKSQFTFKDCFMVGQVLRKVLPTDKYADEDIAKFVIAFAKTCDKLSMDRIEDCAYIYYTIRNITSLAFSEELKSEFSKQIINNVQEAIDLILSIEKERLANKPEYSKKSKKGRKRG